MKRMQVLAQTQSRFLALSILVLLIASGLLIALHGQPAFGAPAATTPAQSLPQTALSADQLYTTLLSSVVRVEGSDADSAPRSFGNRVPQGIERFLPDDMEAPILNGGGTGAGFFIDDAGHIATSASIVAGADTVHVVFSDGAWYAAEVVGSDLQSDLAVLRIPGLDHDFTPLPFAQEDALGIGDTVYAFGFPENLTGTLTRGIVNSMEVRRTGFGGYLLPYLIQSDAVRLPDLAGSPLVNAYGQVVGMNMTMPQPFWTEQTGNLSLPIAFAAQITPALMQGTPYPYPLLGVTGDDLSPAAAAAMELDNLFQGAYITAVGEDTAAANGGIQEGDFLTAVNGTPIHTFSGLAHQLLLRHAGGEEIQITVWRDNQSLDLSVTLGTREPAES